MHKLKPLLLVIGLLSVVQLAAAVARWPVPRAPALPAAAPIDRSVCPPIPKVGADKADIYLYSCCRGYSPSCELLRALANGEVIYGKTLYSDVPGAGAPDCPEAPECSADAGMACRAQVAAAQCCRADLPSCGLLLRMWADRLP